MEQEVPPNTEFHLVFYKHTHQLYTTLARAFAIFCIEHSILKNNSDIKRVDMEDMRRARYVYIQFIVN